MSLYVDMPSVYITIMGTMLIAMMAFNRPENRRRNRRVELAIMPGKVTASAPIWSSGQAPLSPQSAIPLAGADMDFVAASY